jgi:hypothetical protein
MMSSQIMNIGQCVTHKARPGRVISITTSVSPQDARPSQVTAQTIGAPSVGVRKFVPQGELKLK